jgi:CHRD domain-containing protein
MKPKSLLISSPIVAAALVLAANAIAIPIEYVANLSGAREIPPNASPGTGFVTATFDLTTHTLDLHVTFSGLTSATTAAHIHAPTPNPFTGVAGVATQVPYFIDFPIGVTSGTYDHTFNTLDSSFYNPSFLTANGGTPAGAEAAFAQALDQGKAYFNIHTENFGSGEIRGFLHVPDAISTMVCLGIGLSGLEMFRRKFGTQLNA